MTFVKASDLCQSCSCYIPHAIQRITDFSDPTTYIMDCFYEEKRNQERVVECDKFREVEEAFKNGCPLCQTEFYVYFNSDEETDSIDVLEDKCPGCYVNLRVQITTEFLPTTLKQWKETAKMTKENKIGLEFYPLNNISQKVLVSLKDAVGLLEDISEDLKKE